MDLKKLLASALVAAPAALLASSAFAIPCETDADCDEGQYCVWDDDCACPGDGSECVCPGECADFGDGPIDDAECASDADCPGGFICEISTEEICMGMGCPPGEDCPDEEFCEEYSYAMCVPDFSPCSDDADCSDGLVCLTYEYTECEDTAAMPPCPEGEDCPEPEPREEPACETVSESFCAPPYVAPCATDSDCGEGFACVPEEVCWCSGSSGGGSSGSSGGSSGGGAPDPAPDVPDEGGEDSGGSDDGFGDDEPTDPEWDEEWDEDCGCEETGDYYCEPQEIACADDADCPADWTCEEFGAVTATCYEDPETGEVICEEEEVDAEAYCMPPYYDYWGGGAESGGDASGGYEEVIDEATGRSSDDGDGSLSAGGEGASNGAGGDDGRPESDGCSAAGGAPASPLFAGLMLGLVGVLRRRR